MLILFDQNVAVPIRRYLVGHTVKTASQQGWSRLLNGELLRTAERHGFELFLTADQGITYQQSLKGLRMAIVILGKGQWPYIKPVVARVVEAVNAAKPGTVTLVEIPLP